MESTRLTLPGEVAHPSVSHHREEPSLKTIEENGMNRIIYIVGLIVVVVAVLSFFGLR